VLAPQADRICTSPARHLVFDEDGHQRAAAQPYQVAQVAVKDGRTTVDDADREPMKQLTVLSIDLDEVEDQYLADDRGLAAPRNPLVGTERFHDHIGIHPHGPVGGFHQSESFVVSPVGHGAEISNGIANMAG
jgi:hypothetical protein